MVQQARQKSSLRGLWAVIVGILCSMLFTGIIWWAGDWLKAVPHLPDQGPSWYYWKLAEPTFWSRFCVWFLYLAHQFTSWGLIFYAQRRVRKYTFGLHTVNIIALLSTICFIILHFIQTHIFYDGLAQDVSIYSSQGAVIVMLIIILLMEHQRRGVFVGKRLPVSKRVVQFVRKYHGYFFSFAIIYTFWYHPMENTTGHLVGFFYTFLLLLQSCLFFTRIHINKYFTFVQELTVLAHGTLVAIVQGNGLWPMFLFGFAGIFVITQMHGLALKPWIKWSFLLVYILGATLVYIPRGAIHLWELAAIPLIDYGAFILFALLISLGIWIADRLTQKQSTPQTLKSET